MKIITANLPQDKKQLIDQIIDPTVIRLKIPNKYFLAVDSTKARSTI
jgi:hypothetical protein